MGTDKLDWRAFIRQVQQAEPLGVKTVMLDELERRDGRTYDKQAIAAAFRRLKRRRDTPADRELLAAATARLVRASVDAAKWQDGDAREIAHDLRVHGARAHTFYGVLRPGDYLRALELGVAGGTAGRARPRGRRERRHVARSTSSSDPGDSEPPPAPAWRWAQPSAGWQA